MRIWLGVGMLNPFSVAEVLEVSNISRILVFPSPCDCELP